MGANEGARLCHLEKTHVENMLLENGASRFIVETSADCWEVFVATFIPTFNATHTNLLETSIEGKNTRSHSGS